MIRGSCLCGRVKYRITYVGVPLGPLADDPGVRPELHVHVGSKAPWFVIADDLPQLQEGPK